MAVQRYADLAAQWQDLAGDSDPAASVGRDLIARWSEPHRRYHDPDHLRAVLRGVDALAAQARDPGAVRYAAWFHDAVYQGVPGADEEDSARLAEELLPSCGVSPDRVAETARLVRVTAGHDPAEGDVDAEVLCDADLAILAAAPDDYAAYAAKIRQEYAHVPETAFRAGRAQVLRDLLAQPHLFRTARAQRDYEQRARDNVTAEIARLLA